MVTMQFLIKHDVVIDCDVDSATYPQELEQLLKQGFELSGNTISAQSRQHARDLYQQRYGEDLAQYSIFSSLLELPQMLGSRCG